MRKIIPIMALVSLSFLAGCSQGGSPVADPKADGGGTVSEQGALPTDAEAKVANITNLVSCGTTGHRYIDWMALTDASVKKSADSPKHAVEKPSAAYKDLLTVSSEGAVVTIKRKDGFESKCQMPSLVSDIKASLGFSKEAASIATDSGLIMIYLSDILSASEPAALCAKFAMFAEAGAIASVAMKDSIDWTAEITKQNPNLPADVNLSLNKSINLPPPGYRFSADMSNLVADYIYMLNSGGVIYRIKPSMMNGGCVEFIWDGSSLPELPAEIRTEGDQLIVTSGGGAELAKIQLIK